ncbi:hypothetical protein EWM64_g7776 [Hericium alpestre]|uniref:Cation-transporting P-type ATPase N-terminal domain-containing protein n=1 Tax=Hericium alpestre TaxID=135208 RepID=A0A4Y9ZPR2_9AGAM|nr:hypothetical protein EWM64_g7776 [Hericium alpestre]
MDCLINLPVIQCQVAFGPLLDRALDAAEEEDASLLDDASLIQSAGNRDGKRTRRRNKRRAEREKRSPWNYQPKLRVGEKHSTPDVIDVSFGVKDFLATRNAYVAKAQAIVRERPLTVQDLKDIGMPIKEWEGKWDKFNVGYLLGQPNDEDWPAVIAEANRVFEEARVEGEGHFTASEKKTRRGEFVALVAGVTFCKSKEHPDVRGNLEKQQELIDRLCENPAVARIAGFGSASMAYAAPKIYGHYVEHLKPLYERYGLSTLFEDSIFPSANFNLGPKSASAVHADSGNVPYGHCHITALGHFDHKKGGHFVFWDLGFAVEFPPRSNCPMSADASVDMSLVHIELKAEDLYDKEKVNLETIVIGDVFKLLQCDEQGLTAAETTRCLEIFGPNQLESEVPNPFLQFLSFMWNPSSWVVKAVALVAIPLSNSESRPLDWEDFVGIVLLLFINSSIGFYEEHNAGNAVKALMDSLAPNVKCRRDGSWSEIESSVFAPSDLVLFKIGDIVPADCCVIEAINVSIDQAALTASRFPSQLAEHKVLVTHITAIEELAGVTVLCSDKTGMLTANKLTIDRSTIKTYGPFSTDDVILLAAYASHTENQDAIDSSVVGALSNVGRARMGIKPLDFKPFNPMDKRMIGLIIELCMCNKTEELENRLETDVEEFATRGLRTLAVAHEELDGQDPEAGGYSFERIGVLAIFDPRMRISSRPSTTLLRSVLKDGPGSKFCSLDEMIMGADGFAGVFPEHKFEIVKLLSTIVHAICGSRVIFQRMRNYAIYACAVTIHLVVCFSVLAFCCKFSFPPFMVLIIALLNDGTILTLFVEQVLPSSTPDSWDLAEIFAFAIAYRMTASTVILVVFIIESTWFQCTSGVSLTNLPGKRVDRNDPQLHMIVYRQVAIILQALNFITHSHVFFLSIPRLR